MSVKHGKMRLGALILALVLNLGCIYPAADTVAEIASEASSEASDTISNVSDSEKKTVEIIKVETVAAETAEMNINGLELTEADSTAADCDVTEETTAETEPYTDIFTSEWYRNGYDQGLYRNKSLDHTVGWKYQNETISNILLMAEDPILIAGGWTLESFFKGTIFEALDLDTLKELQIEGIEDMGYFLGISMFSFSDSYTLSATASGQFKSFAMDIYDDVHGTLYLLELGEHNAFCINYGKHSPKGTTYTKKTSSDYLTSSQEEVIKQGLLFFLWLQNSKESGNKVWGEATDLVDINNTSGYYLYMQVWVWAAMKGYDSYECADIMRDTIISWSSDNTSWANGYYNWAVQFLDAKLYEKYLVDMTVYSSGVSSNQDMFVYDFSSIDIPKEPSPTPSRSRLQLIKTSSDGTRLTDAEFTLYEWNGTSFVTKEKLTHVGNGVYQSSIILQCTTTNQGKWKVKETKAPANHVLDPSGIELNIADELVKAWYQSFLGKAPTTTQLNTLANRLKGGTSEYAVMREFATSSAVNAKSNAVYTEALYELILQREPTSDNLSYWNTKLTDDSYTRGTMFDYFWTHADHENGVLAWKAPRVVLEYTVENSKNGRIKLTKTSSNTGITSGSSYYSFEGAVYGVYSDSSCKTEVDTMTTDSEGVAYSKGLPPGTYYIKELTPSTGYDVDTKVHTAIVTSSTSSTPSVVEVTSTEPPKTGEIRLVKKAAQDTDFSLKGAVYGVYKNSACTTLVTKITTDANGEGSASGLALGSYYVKEITAPDGFELDPTVYSVSCSSTNATAIVGSIETITDDDPEGYAYVVKRGSNADVEKYPSYYTMAGAVYGIYESQTEANSDTNRLGTMTTDANGISNAVKIPLGTYYVKEISAPKGFKLDSSTHKVIIAQEGRTYQVYSTDVAITSRIRLTKTSSNSITVGVSSYTLEGAVYGVYTDRTNANNKGTPDWTFTTNASGVATIYLPGGYSGAKITYYIREVIAPTGYLLDDTVHTVSLTQGTNAELSVTDEPIIPEFELTKTSTNTLTLTNSNYSLEGAQFGIYTSWDNAESKGTPDWTITTDADGKATIDIPGGSGSSNITYYVRELVAPKGYKLDDTLHSAYVNQESGSTLIVEDEPETTEISLIKSSAEDMGISLEGAVYGVYSDSACTDEVTTITTDAEGKGSAKELPYATYYVKEIKAPEGYALDATVYTASCTTPTPVVINSVEDLTMTEFTLVKTSANSVVLGNTGYSLANAKYCIYLTEADAKAGTNAQWTITTDADGKASIELPNRGGSSTTYYVREKTAPTGYKLDSTVYAVTIGPDAPGLLEVQDEPRMASFELIKTSTDSSTLNSSYYSLEGAVYGIYTSRADAEALIEPKWTLTTDADGKASIELPGAYSGYTYYYIREITAPKGYALDDTVYYTYLRQGNSKSLTVKDEPAPGFAYIVKRNEDPGYTNTIESYTLLNAVFGVYATEAEAIAATFVAQGDPVCTLTTTIEIKDTENPDYVAYKAETEPVELAAGKYYVKELQAPEGFVPDNSVHVVNVTPGSTTEVEIVNIPIPVDETIEEVSISILKVDINNMPLAGSTFLIEWYDEAGAKWVHPYSKNPDPAIAALPNEVTSGSDGKVSFTRLMKGTYRITETAAPEGYSLLAEPVEIELPIKIPTMVSPGGADMTQDGNDYFLTYNLTVQDGQLINMPFTGGVGILYPVVGGTILTFTGGLLIRRKRKKG